MNQRALWRRVAVRIVTLIFLLLLAGLLAPAVVQAEGGLALSGSFYNQNFVIPQGASVSGPSIDVVVFNNSSEPMNVMMLSQAPQGVTISFSNGKFTITPGGQQQVLVTVAVATNVSAGDYDLSVIAKSYKEDATGIQIAGAAGQTTKLKVTGESALVTLRALSPDGQPLVAVVRLYRLVNGQNQELAYSETGTLQTTVAPGDFKAASYIGGQQVAEQTFTLANGDNKTIDLTGATIYFASFGVVPNYASETSKLAFVQIVYTVKNIYQQVDKGDVILQVNFNGTPQTPLTLMTLSPLTVGSSGLYYNYTPTGGWSNGTYDFHLQLNLDEKIYNTSTVQQLQVTDITDTTVSEPDDDGGGMNDGVIAGIIAGIVVVVIAVFFFLRKKRGV